MFSKKSKKSMNSSPLIWRLLSKRQIDVEDFATMVIQHEDKIISELHLDFLRPVKKRGCEVVGAGCCCWVRGLKNPPCRGRLFTITLSELSAAESSWSRPRLASTGLLSAVWGSTVSVISLVWPSSSPCHSCLLDSRYLSAGDEVLTEAFEFRNLT